MVWERKLELIYQEKQQEFKTRTLRIRLLRHKVVIFLTYLLGNMIPIALQLAQYVSTVANNGIRVQPHVVEGIYGNDENGALGKILKEIEPKVLNKVNISEDQIGILQQGFYNVVNGTSPFTTARGLKSDKFSIAAKTGTAETQATDANGVNHTTVNSNLVLMRRTKILKLQLALFYHT